VFQHMWCFGVPSAGRGGAWCVLGSLLQGGVAPGVFGGPFFREGWRQVCLGVPSSGRGGAWCVWGSLLQGGVAPGVFAGPCAGNMWCLLLTAL
jgi:hypothetical protein